MTRPITAAAGQTTPLALHSPRVFFLQEPQGTNPRMGNRVEIAYEARNQ